MTSKNEPQFVTQDTSNLKGETVKLVLVRVDKIPNLLAEGNPKLHDIGATWESVKSYNFNDPSKIDMNLTNVSGEKGAFVYGNGRNEALYWGWSQYQQGAFDEIPKGVRYDDDYWYIPVMIGVDTDSEFEAKAFMIDHNNLTVMGGNIDIGMIANLYDKEALALMTKDLGENMQVPITFDGQDIDALHEMLLSNDSMSQDTSPEDFPEYNDDIDTQYCCPECGYEWSGKPK